MAQKEALRKKLEKLRNQLTPEQRKAKSDLVRKNLFQLDEFKKAKTIMFFVSFRSEVETLPMIKKTLAAGKKVAVPLVEKTPKGLAAIEIKNPSTDLRSGTYGIPEPKENNMKLQPGKIDLVLVPGLGFDHNGKRVGYGKGYYDIWLKRFPKKKRIGAAFDFQIVSKIPAMKFDLAVGKVVTDKRIIGG